MKYFIREAKKFLDLNWKENIYKNSCLNHKDIADLLDLRYRPSLSMCKRNFGMTIERFFIHCRVAETKEFLSKPENNSYNLQEVVHKLGHAHQPNFNRQFKIVMGITVQEFKFFHKHFVKITGMTLVEYEKPELEYYVPEDGKPTFLANFLNKKRQEVLQNQFSAKM